MIVDMKKKNDEQPKQNWETRDDPSFLFSACLLLTELARTV